MTGWHDEAVQSLLCLARGGAGKEPFVPEQPCVSTIVEDGLILDANTGRVLRSDLSLDAGPYGFCAPIYSYDRTNRFSCLLTPAGVPIGKRHLVIRVFEQLEQLWESTKENYKRKYFLSQKLVLREICLRLGIPCSLPIAIRDTKRRRNQMRIFDKMWRFLLSSKL